MSFQVCSLKKAKNNIEILVKPGTVNLWKQGKLGIDNVLVSEEIFKNHSKMERASETEISAVIGDLRGIDALKEILTRGEIAMTTAERREKVDHKRKEILNFIHSNYMDPTNNLPHPVTRLETAMESFRYVIDPFKDVEDQAVEIVEKMKSVLPLSKHALSGELFIPHKFLAQAQGVLKKFTTKEREKYDPEGCTMAITIVPGNFDKLMQELAKTTKGDHRWTPTNLPGQDKPLDRPVVSKQHQKEAKKQQYNENKHKKK